MNKILIYLIYIYIYIYIYKSISLQLFTQIFFIATFLLYLNFIMILRYFFFVKFNIKFNKRIKESFYIKNYIKMTF